MEYEIVSYETFTGKKPFDEWLEKLRRRDHVMAEAGDARLARIRDKGNFGDHRAIGNALYELRIHLGPGYRIYYLMPLLSG